MPGQNRQTWESRVPEKRVLISGGGIGGLSAALGLAKHGIPTLVIERAAELGEIGAGIQLGPNAFHAFDYLGIGEAARETAVYVDQLLLMDALSAEAICSIPLDDAFRKRFKNPYAVVHRGELHGVMLAGCKRSPLIDLRTSSEVTGYQRNDGAIEAILASGERVRGRALVAADGLWSKVRQQIVGDGMPRVTGHTTYRSVVPFDQMPEELRLNAATLWAGPKCHLVHYPLSGWKLFNLVVTFHNNAPEPVAGAPVSQEEVMRGFEHIHPRAQQIIRVGQDWKKWVLCDREPVMNWADGNAVLLGDAAHPTLQYLAQGACMAMEDSVILAHECGKTPDDIEAAFQRYQTRRRLRTARIQLQSRAVGEHVYHPSGAHAALRNEIMRAKSTSDWYETMDWLYGAHDIVAAVNG